MSPNEIDRFLERLADFGLWVSVVPLTDGTLHLAKWKTPSFWTNSDAAEALWADFVGKDPERLDELTRLLHEKGYYAKTPRVVTKADWHADHAVPNKQDDR